MVAVCLAIGVSIALADDSVVPAAPTQGQTLEAVDPDHRITDDSLAAVEDIHEFGEPSVLEI
jgi:hypothetical protein